MTVKNPEREHQSLLQWKHTRFIPKAFQNQGQRLLLSFVQELWICQALQKANCPTLPFLLWCVGGSRGPNDSGWEEMLPKCSPSREHVPGMERGGRKGGRKEAGWMHGCQNPLGRRQIKRQRLEHEEESERGRASCCSSPLPLGRWSQGLLPPERGERQPPNSLPAPGSAGTRAQVCRATHLPSARGQGVNVSFSR